ncbi:ABC transporter permease [Sphingorhabdus contaminans]|uniref:ABC transporter permease n=1 Tax=Sphingorhabdus contaminans TaxID=1343899 RepID=UPI003D2D680E
MAKIVVLRMAMLAMVMLGVSIITFFVARIIPGDPALLIAGPRATPEMLATIRTDLGLDQPIFVQYVGYMRDLLQGDLGASIMTGKPVGPELFRYMPATLELMLMALLLTLAIGVPLGVLTALRRDRWLDTAGRGFAMIGISMPTFWVGLLLILVFYGWLGILPGSGRLDTGLAAPPFVTGLYLVDGLIAGNLLVVKSAFNHLLLPAAALAFASIGIVVRMIRASMIEVMNEDYIRTMRAFGLSRRTIIGKHALPNALLPFVTVLGLELATLLFGSVIVESVFAWPGVGSYVLSAILNLDFPIVMGFTILASVVYVFANLLVDLAYLLLDPRMRGSVQ